jgi:hypothetical protein
MEVTIMDEDKEMIKEFFAKRMSWQGKCEKV